MKASFRLLSMVVAVSAFLAATASANPTGHQVVTGKVSIQPTGVVLSTPGNMVNWQTFSISANEITRFISQSPSSAVLNRVTGQNLPILGSLQSNGSVLPIGPVVVNGQATISQSGNLLQITNSPNSIINWQSFSIGANESTRFLQQSASSAVLNRVVGAGGTIDPSVILGALHSNGRVFLINPSGIVFGAGSQIDVPGLVASSLNLSNADFLAGRLRFTEAAGAGSVVNQGVINAASGGQVYLVGPSVTNSGIITTPRGGVILAAGNSVELVNPGTPNLRVEINAPDNEAVNLGQIIARSGRIGIHAGLIRSTGALNADRAVAGPAGEIRLKATKSISVEGTISASGGTITVDAGERAAFNGAILQTHPGISVTGGNLVGTTITLTGGNAGGNISINAVGGGSGNAAGNSGGNITINAAGGGTGNAGGSITVGGGTICPASSSQACGGASRSPSIGIVGNSGSSRVTVNGVLVPSMPVTSRPEANSAPAQLHFELAAQALRIGTGQIVDSLLSTIQLGDAVRTMNGTASGELAAPRGKLTFE